MPAPFAAVEARANIAVLATLTNAVAVVNGAEVAVIFDQPFASPFDGQLDAAAPTCVGPVSALGSLERDDEIAIGGTAYMVVTAEPDGAGMVLLTLAGVAGMPGG